MSRVEVLAVEVRQFTGQNLKALVPQVIGQTAESVATKGSRPARQWDEVSFFDELAKAQDGNVVGAARRILAWATPRMTRIWYGYGTKLGSLVPILNHNGRDHQLFALWTSGTIEVYFQWYKAKAPFDLEEKRLDFLNRLNSIPGVQIPIDAIGKRPSFSLSAIASKAAMEQFLQAYDWFIEQVKTT